MIRKKKCNLKCKGETIEGYGSFFGNVDADGDVIEKGAFSESLEKRKGRIPWLLFHDFSKPIGKFDVIKETDSGLFFQGQLSKSTLGQDVAVMIDEGVLNENSVQFMIKDAEPNDTGGYNIKKAELLEISTVTLAANEKAVFRKDAVELFQVMNFIKANPEAGKKIYSYLRKEFEAEDADKLNVFIKTIKQTIKNA